MLRKTQNLQTKFLKSSFYTIFNDKLLKKFHQQFKNFPKLILITFSAKKTPSNRNGNQKYNGVCGHDTTLSKIGLKEIEVIVQDHKYLIFD